MLCCVDKKWSRREDLEDLSEVCICSSNLAYKMGKENARDKNQID
jgi:hypothetical protein